MGMRGGIATIFSPITILNGKGKDDTYEWQPAFLNMLQYKMMWILCKLDEFDYANCTVLPECALNAGYESVEELIQSLCETTLWQDLVKERFGWLLLVLLCL